MLRFFYLSTVFIIYMMSSCTSSTKDAAVTTASTSVAFTEADVEEYDMDDVYSAVRDRGEVLLVYGSQLDEVAKEYQKIASAIQQDFKRIKIRIKSDEEVTVEELKQYPIYLFGSTKSNKILQEATKESPFLHTTNGFTFDKTSYSNPQDFYMLGIYPSPYNPRLPISVFSGNDDQVIIKSLHQLFQSSWRRIIWNSWGYQIFRDGKRIVLGQFSRKKSTQWAVDKVIHWNFENMSTTNDQSPHFQLITHGNFEKFETVDLLPTCEATLQQIESFIGKKTDLKIKLHIYPTLEEKGLAINNTQQANIDFRKKEAHMVINEEFRNNFVQIENELILRDLLGEPKQLALEKGLAIRFTKQWQREGYDFWAAKLHASGNLIPLSELLDNEFFEQESALVFGAMAGVMADFLIEHWGQESFLAKYANWQPSTKELHKLEKAWEAYFDNQKSSKLTKQTSYKPFIPSYIKGFNFAHEGYNIYNGYTSKLAETSLDTLNAIGSNAIAIVPYSYMGNPNKPSFLKFSRWAGSETDESVIHSSFQAKKRGMHTLLKPQIWLGKSWPGDVDMDNDADWDKFFDYYNRWMRHYALLAEIHQIDMLCLGVEFAKATIARPDDWKRMANSYRHIYSGPLTYAANWGDEAEKTVIWSAFDFIGVNCYYPLSKRSNPSDKELKQAFKETLSMLERKLTPYQKPVIFTEIGFRSIDDAWKEPHAEAKDNSYNQEAQARCYEAVFSNLPKQKWIKGMFWWKWPSYMNYANRKKQSFAPTTKQAEKVIKKWFEKL